MNQPWVNTSSHPLADGAILIAEFLRGKLPEWKSGIRRKISEDRRSLGLAVEAENTAGDMEAVSVPFPATVPLQGSPQSAPPKFFRVAVSAN